MGSIKKSKAPLLEQKGLSCANRLDSLLEQVCI